MVAFTVYKDCLRCILIVNDVRLPIDELVSGFLIQFRGRN